MANNRWVGASAPGTNVTTNWSTGALPTTGEDVSITVESDGQPGPDGATMDDSVAVLVNSIYFGPGYTKTWGSSTTPFRVSFEQLLYEASSGKLWMSEGTNAAGSNTVICNSSALDPIAHDCLNLAETLYDRLLLRKGLATIQSGCAITDVKVGIDGGGTTAKLVIADGATSPSVVTMLSGVGLCSLNSSALARLDMYNGDWTQNAGSNVITTINLYGGILRLHTAGTFAEINHFGGTIDATKGGVHTPTIYRRIPMGLTKPIVLGEGNPAMWAPPTALPNLVYMPNAA